MKKVSKWTMGVVLLVIVLSSFAGSAFAGESGQVNLLKASLFQYKYGYKAFSGDIEVKNLALDKKVTIRYTTGNGQWYDTDASYAGSLDSTNEKWSFSISTSDYRPEHPELKGADKIDFAIKYVVNGQEYWDNNNGKNYSISSYNMESVILGKPNVLRVYDASDSYNNMFTGTVYVKNLAYDKKVTIVYTTDNWKTTKESPAVYSNQVNGFNTVEAWGFQISAAPTINQITYAIKYTVGGQTYWDNNYGKNYTINR